LNARYCVAFVAWVVYFYVGAAFTVNPDGTVTDTTMRVAASVWLIWFCHE